MKILVRMKDPDRLQDAIEDAVKAEVGALALANDEAAALCELRAEKAAKVAAAWFEYGEYLEVEIDTNAETCVVVPVDRGRP